MRVRTDVLVAVIAMSLVGCALSHHPSADGGPRNDARADVSLDGVDVPRDGTDVPPPDADAGCPAGTQLCGGTCVSVDAVDHCGSCSNDCTMLPGVNRAAVTCSAGGCVLTGACAAGYADCDPGSAGCETLINDATHCGTCTTACSGGTPACSPDGSGSYHCTNGCTVAGQSLCGSSCTDTATDVMNCGGCGNSCAMHDHAVAMCAGSTCTWTCIAGYHDCGAGCVSDLLPTSCGSSCTPCMPTSANATATCSGGTCGFVCNSGFHLCGGNCVSDSDVATCGSSCGTPCATAANAMTTCSGGICGLTCNTGFHSCGSGASFLCARDNDPAHCGGACTACSSPTNGSATCVGGSCSFGCSSGFHACASSGTCESDTDAAHCGSGCTVCPMPSNATPTCVSGTCGFTCNAGFTLSGGACVAAPMCGNRALDSGESCDDGNRNNGDGCDSNCHMESGFIVDSCGSGRMTIPITDRGAHIYTGTTAGMAADGSGPCSATGRDVIWDTNIMITGPFAYTATFVTTSSWNGFLRYGGPGAACPPGNCTVPAAGTSFTTGTGNNTLFIDYGADSMDTSSGSFTFTLTVM